MPATSRWVALQNFVPKTLLEIWDGTGLDPCHSDHGDARRRPSDPDHQLLSVQARAGVVEVTAHHNMLDPDHQKIPACDVEDGDELALWEEVPVPCRIGPSRTSRWLSS